MGCPGMTRSRMRWLGWAVVALALLQGGYMVFDGVRALLLGEYLTPSSGEYAGELGPWASLVAAIGIDPEGTLMKLVFVVFGAAWLVGAAGMVLAASWARRLLLGLAAGTLWYLVVGTVVSVATLALLLVGRRFPAPKPKDTPD